MSPWLRIAIAESPSVAASSGAETSRIRRISLPPRHSASQAVIHGRVARHGRRVSAFEPARSKQSDWYRNVGTKRAESFGPGLYALGGVSPAEATSARSSARRRKLQCCNFLASQA